MRTQPYAARLHARGQLLLLVVAPLLVLGGGLPPTASPTATGAPVTSLLHGDDGPTGGSPEVASHLSFPLQIERSTSLSELASSPRSTPSSLLPSDLRGPYGVDALLNSTVAGDALAVNETIGIVAWGNGYNPQDLATFFSMFYPSSFPAPRVIPMPVDGAPPPGINAEVDPSNGSRELTLDIEWAASMAPGATIYAIYGPAGTIAPYSPTDQSIEDAVAAAVDLGNLTALSLSFGEAEGSDSSLQSVLSSDFSQLVKNGTTVVAASGDDGGAPFGAPASCTGGPGVDFPASDPDVLAVGGTDATGSSETSWDLSGGGSASSAAADPAPWWQKLGSASAMATLDGTRGVPDVAASAEDNGFFFDGSYFVGDGTSFAAPIWAGVLVDTAAADGTHWGLLSPTLYRLAAAAEARPGTPKALLSATGGGNCFYPASPGWNPVTGWGTPQAEVLASQLANESFSNLSLSVAPSVGVGAGTSVDVAVEATAGGSPILTGDRFALVVLDPDNDSPVLTLYGIVPAPGAAPWTGSFVMPSGMGDREVNLSVVVSQGGVWGVGSAAILPPTSTVPSGPSFLDLLVEYQLPILGGFLVILLLLRFAGARRRAGPSGPAPSSLAESGPAAGELPMSGAEASAATPTARRATGSPSSSEMVPFCWRCGTNLTGNEAQCPSCGARFAS